MPEGNDRGTDGSLRLQLRLYEAVLKTTPDLAYIFDLQHRFIYANEGLLRMWGKSWDEAIGKTCLELGYEPWHAEMHDREIEQVVATGMPIRGAVPFSGAMGRRIYDYIFTPVVNAAGEVEAVAGTTRDVTEMRAAEEEVRRRSQQLETLINQAPIGVYLVDSDLRIVQLNPIAVPVFGDIPGGAAGRDFGDVMRMLWTPEYADELVCHFRHTLQTGEPYATAERIERRIDRNAMEAYEWRADRIVLADGRYGIVCYFRDVSGQVKARQAQQLLIDELNHRVKNTLAIVQSIATHTLRGTPDPERFKTTFTERLAALADAHKLLTHRAWGAACLGDIIRGALAPYRQASDAVCRFVVEGHPVSVSPSQAVALALALHELATNAVKHGSLSGPEGRLVVTWTVDCVDGREPRIELSWRESHGPPVAEPTRHGFGTRLIRASAEQVRGTLDLRYEPSGVVCRLIVPAARMSDTPIRSRVTEDGPVPSI